MEQQHRRESRGSRGGKVWKSLATAMEEKALDPAGLAAKLTQQGYSVSQWAVIAWLEGKRKPTVDGTEAVASILGVESGALLSDCPAKKFHSSRTESTIIA